jgi:hypothetical protein
MRITSDSPAPYLQIHLLAGPCNLQALSAPSWRIRKGLLLLSLAIVAWIPLALPAWLILTSQ